jgi:hypothetical protein
MPREATDLARTIKAMRPTLPAKDFEISERFYRDLGFQARTLTDGLAEIHLGAFSFILQNYYVRQWADNLVMHLFVSDVSRWWDHVVTLDLASRYGVKTIAPRLESWGARVAGVVDPSDVLWRFHEVPASHSESSL